MVLELLNGLGRILWVVRQPNVVVFPFMHNEHSCPADVPNYWYYKMRKEKMREEEDK